MTKRGVIHSPQALDDPPGGSLGEWLRFLGAMPQESDWIPVWPPDAFAIAAAILRRTGAYVNLVNGTSKTSPKTRSRPSRASHEPDASAVGREWRKTLASVLEQGETKRLRDACPEAIRGWWAEMLRCRTSPLAECAKDPHLLAAAVNLCVAGDAACDDIGVDVRDPFLVMAELVLDHNERRSLCLRVPVEKLAVLPKRHTPQRGCTIRSLSHNLALFTPTEIRAMWESPYKAASGDLDLFNLLLLPWPVAVEPGDFCVSGHRAEHDVNIGLSGDQRYFDYRPRQSESPAKLAARVAHAIDVATREVDRIHGVALPELSLTFEQFLAVEKVVVKRHAILISGVRGEGSRETNGLPYNACVIQPLGLTDLAKAPGRIRDVARRIQLKHHRWCLDRDQILQYELGGRLPAAPDCWERIYIGPRAIRFVTFTTWLTTCVLICEDLARQDPVTEVIRSVGPHLVFALLMDGPQLRNRWPSRYASVLAEDPGCSVLSMTSLGMAQRSRPRQQSGDTSDKRSTIALWRDAIYGEREIALEPGHNACVLSLVKKTATEFTIGAGTGSHVAAFPVYAGARSISCARQPRKRTRQWPRYNARRKR